MVVDQVVAPYWEIFVKLIIDDSTTKYEYTEIRENNVNVSHQLDYNFILKDVESWIPSTDISLYAKGKKTRLDGTNMQNNEEANL